MDATASSDDKAVATTPSGRRALPMRKRKGLHLDLPSVAKKTHESDDEDEDHQKQQKQPKKKKRGLLKQSSKRRSQDQDGKSPKKPPESHNEQQTKVKRRSSQAKGWKKASSAKNKESPSNNDRKEDAFAAISSISAIAVAKNNKEGIWPQINDVLMGKQHSSSLPFMFHHIGNRRFRVLVEASLANYFSDITMQELLAAEDTVEPTTKQCQVVEAVIASVEGNVPAGRFLVHCPAREDPDGENEVSSNEPMPMPTDYGSNWKLASRTEIEDKVHSTFLAAGRFHVKKHAAALMVLDASSSQMGSGTLTHQVRSEEEGATDGAAQSEEQQIRLEEALKAVQAAATVVEVDVKPTAAAASSTDSPTSALSSSNSSTSSNETVAAETVAASKNNEHANFYSNAMITNALSKYHAKNQQVVAEQTAAAALEEMFLAVSVRKREEDEMKPPAAAEVATNSEIDYLAKESMRIRAISAARGRGEIMQGGVVDGEREQHNSLHLPNIVPNYLPSQNNAKGTSVEGTSVEGTAAAMLSLPLPSSIDELYTISSSSATSATRRSPSSSQASSEGSISPLPRPAAVVAPQLPDVAAVLLKQEVKNQEEDSVASVDNSTAVNTLSLLDVPVSLQCPARIKVFFALPMDRFFVKEEDDSKMASTYSHSAPVPLTVSPSSYIMPSNYDIFCGSGQSFFHHVGNRRFRIMIEMNVRRYEKAYLASSGAPYSSSSGSPMSSYNMGEDSIQKLINETVITLSLCDPPGRFLGMEMTTGRWRVLNPIFAQLKTEQTFFECLQVKQSQKVRQLEEEWKERIQMEKEMLLEELEGRMMASVESARRASTVATMAPVAPTAALVDQQLPVTQDSLPDNGGGAVCPARNFRPLLAEEDMSTLQKQAKALLRRRQIYSCPQVTNSSTFQAASPTTLPTSTPTVEELKSMAMLEIVQRFAQERQTEAASQERVLLSRLQHQESEVWLQEERRTSLPMLSAPSSSFSSQQQGNCSSLFSPVMSRRESNFSCESSDHSSTATAVVQPTTSTQQHQCHQQQAAASSPIDDNVGHHQVKDLLDVVGGMMMMSRRSSP